MLKRIFMFFGLSCLLLLGCQTSAGTPSEPDTLAPTGYASEEIQRISVFYAVSYTHLNNPGAYALERARNHGVPAECISPKDFPDRASFNEALVAKVDSYDLDLVVLAGFLVKIPEAMIAKYRNKIINIHPSLIPSFCGVGYYGLKVHEACLLYTSWRRISQPPLKKWQSSR